MKYIMVLMLMIVGVMAVFVGSEQLIVDAAPVQQNQQQMSTLEITNRITTEWAQSDKQAAVPSIREQFLVTQQAPQGNLRVACARCHDGHGAANFTYFNANPAQFNLVNVPHSTGITCQGCHSGDVRNVMHEGTVQVLFRDQPFTNAGSSASCIYCHNGNRDPRANYAASAAGTLTNLPYPHYGMQAALWSGQGAMQVPGVTYKNSRTHASILCVDCHMPITNEGYSDHTFTMNVQYIGQTCGTCHRGITDFNYNNIQNEIRDDLARLRAEIVRVSGADDFVMTGGQFRFMKNGTQMPVAQINRAHEVYYAVYNWRTVYYDRSFGIHNPSYARDLISRAFRALDQGL